MSEININNNTQLLISLSVDMPSRLTGHLNNLVHRVGRRGRVHTGQHERTDVGPTCRYVCPRDPTQIFDGPSCRPAVGQTRLADGRADMSGRRRRVDRCVRALTLRRSLTAVRRPSRGGRALPSLARRSTDCLLRVGNFSLPVASTTAGRPVACSL